MGHRYIPRLPSLNPSTITLHFNMIQSKLAGKIVLLVAITAWLILACGAPEDGPPQFELIAFSDETPWLMTRGTGDDIIVSTRKSTSSAATTNYLHLSSDGGESWEPIAVLYGSISDLEVDMSGNVYVCIGYELRKMEAGQRSWDVLDLGSGQQSALYITPDNHLISTNTVRDSLCISKDSGETWESLGHGLAYTTFSCISSDGTGSIYIGFANTGSNSPPVPLGVYKLAVGDTLWKYWGMEDIMVSSLNVSPSGQLFAGSWHDDIYRPMTMGDTLSLLWDIPSLEGYNHPVKSIEFNSKGSMFVIVQRKRALYSSQNGGESWEMNFDGLPLEISDPRSLLIDNDDYLYLLDPSGLYKSTEPTK